MALDLRLEELKELYDKAKQNEYNPQELTRYIIEYMSYREIGLQHKPAMQLLRKEYLGVYDYEI